MHNRLQHYIDEIVKKMDVYALRCVFYVKVD